MEASRSSEPAPRWEWACLKARISRGNPTRMWQTWTKLISHFIIKASRKSSRKSNHSRASSSNRGSRWLGSRTWNGQTEHRIRRSSPSRPGRAATWRISTINHWLMLSKNNKIYSRIACKCPNSKWVALPNNKRPPFLILNTHLSHDTLLSRTQQLRISLWINIQLISRSGNHKTVLTWRRTREPASRPRLPAKSRGQIPRPWLCHRVRSCSHRSNGACKEGHSSINRRWLEGMRLAHLPWTLAWSISRPCRPLITKTVKSATKTRSAW